MAKASLSNPTNLWLEEQVDDMFEDTFEEEVLELPRKKSKPAMYPTTKPGHSSKDRRYVPITKKSDAKKVFVRSGTGKGAKNKKKVCDTPA